MAEAVMTPGPTWLDLTYTTINMTYTNMTNTTESEPIERWRQTLDFVATIVLTLNTVIFMLGMGAAIYIKELWEHAKRPIGALIGMVGQFLVLPAVGFSLCLMFKLKPYESLGVLMISCCPGGTFSNFFTYWLDGDLALSILMTTCSSVIAFFGMPFNLWLYSKYWISDDKDELVIPYNTIMKSLAFITIPVVIGIIVRYFNKRAADIITKISALIGWLGVVAGAAIWLVLYWRSFVMATPLIYVAALLLPITGFILAFILARATCQNNKIARTVGIETGCQNMPVALSIILLSFSDPLLKSQMMLFPTLYGVLLITEAVVFISTYQLVKKLCFKDDDYPTTYTARVEPGTRSEKTTFRV